MHRPGFAVQSGTQLAVYVVMCCLVSGTAPAVGAQEEKGRFCTKTAQAAFRGCRYEIRDGFWVANGNCLNLANDHARAKCQEEAKIAQIEGAEECGLQFEARLDICKSLGEAPYDPKIDPAKFVDPAKIGKTIAPNPYLPLVRGRTWIYQGGLETITKTVTEDTKEILGVTCAVIHDVAESRGAVIEDTKDWYAQDIYGNVWYFGEISQQFEDNELASIEGSWKGGADSAKPGIVMKGAPAIGDVYRQEFALSNAEDMGEVLSLTESATVPAAACQDNCLVIKDFLPIHPDSIEHKYYAHGIGLILAVHPDTGEREELVEIRY